MTLTIDHINALDELVDDNRRNGRVAGQKLMDDAMAELKKTLCQSQNGHKCHGVMWQCAECGKLFCCIEGQVGSDICDVCWSEGVAQ